MTKITIIIYDSFTYAHIQFLYLTFFNYWFPYCIHLYTGSTQQVIVAQYMCWFLKASDPPMFGYINYFNFIPDGFWYGTYLTDYNELFLLLWIQENIHLGWVNSSLTLWQSDWRSTLFLPILYLYFRSIYLFPIIPNSCLSSGPFTGPQQFPFSFHIWSAIPDFSISPRTTAYWIRWTWWLRFANHVKFTEQWVVYTEKNVLFCKTYLLFGKSRVCNNERE